jgi:RHS repeat-associated protein
VSSNDYLVTYAYDLVNNLTQIARATDGQNLAYTYDALGRMTNETQPFGALAYQYDAAGDRTRMTWADGFYASYAYDTLGSVTSVTANGATSGVGVLATYTFDNLGRRTGVAYGNGTSRTYAYDAVSRLAGMQLAFPNTANNHVIGGVGGSGTPISYTPSSQIASIARSNDAYAWTGAYNVSRTYTANGLNQYTNSGGVTLGYDARGNLSSSTPATGGATTYAYTKLNELVSVPGTASIYYDPLSRVSEYDTTASTRFYYSGGTPVAEVANPSGAVTQRYVPGPGTDEIVAWYSGTGNTTTPQFLQTDERGSVIAVTNSAGALVGTNSYDEYGIPASTNVGRIGYTGQTWFPEIGLYNFKARWYSPSLGRFMQTDPLGYGDGINWHNYAHGDPINGSDPSGLEVYSCNGSGCYDSSNNAVPLDTILHPGDQVTNGYATFTEDPYSSGLITYGIPTMSSGDIGDGLNITANHSCSWYGTCVSSDPIGQISASIGISTVTNIYGGGSRAFSLTPQSGNGRSFWDCTANHGGWKDLAAFGLDAAATAIAVAQPELVLLPMALSAASMTVTAISAKQSEPGATYVGLGLGSGGFMQAGFAQHMSISSAGSLLGRNWGKIGTGLAGISAVNDARVAYNDYSACMAGKP